MIVTRLHSCGKNGKQASLCPFFWDLWLDVNQVVLGVAGSHAGAVPARRLI